MFRFTIRDVLWLTVVVALGAGWWSESGQAARLLDENQTLTRSHAMLQEAIEIMDEQRDSLLRGDRPPQTVH